MFTIFSNLSSVQTGAINKISFAYKTINMPRVRRGGLVRSSKYIAKRNGDRTEPYRTPKITTNRHDHASYHLTQEYHPDKPTFRYIKQFVE